MDCCQCQGIEGLFNQREAARRLKAFQRKGSETSTRVLLDALRAAGIEGATLLDIGGGIGAIQLELLGAGASSATDVDASTAYISAARDEAARRGFGDRVTYQHWIASSAVITICVAWSAPRRPKRAGSMASSTRATPGSPG